MEDSRLTVLQYINEHRHTTVNELAEALGLAAISVRYHLNLLEREGLIGSQKVRGAVGRPSNAYAITSAGREKLPQSYDRLAARMLSEIKEFATPTQIEAIFRGMAEMIVGERKHQLEGAPLQTKIDALVALLGAEGFLARWEQVNGDYLLKGYNCPYQHVRQSHPEICQLDKQIISTMLKTPVELDTCIADGDECCTYHVKSERLLEPVVKR
jgi:predicted ArsR family transcriptional regulator